MAKLTREQTANGLLILTTVIWGGGFIITKVAVDAGFPPSFVLAARFLLGVVFMLAVFWRDIRKTSSEEFKVGCVAGGMLFLAFLVQTIGIQYTSPSNNALITSSNVVMVPFVTWALMGKRPPIKTILLSFVCFLGMCVLSYTPDVGLSFNKGDLLTLLCAFCYACHISFLGFSAGRIENVAALNFVQLLVAAVISTMYFLAFEFVPITLPQLYSGAVGLVFLGVFSTGLCFFMQSYAQQILPPVRIAIMLSLEGMFGSIMSVMAGYDALSLHLVLGAVIILFSLIALETDLIALVNRNKKETQ